MPLFCRTGFIRRCGNGGEARFRRRLRSVRVFRRRFGRELRHWREQRIDRLDGRRDFRQGRDHRVIGERIFAVLKQAVDLPRMGNAVPDDQKRLPRFAAAQGGVAANQRAAQIDGRSRCRVHQDECVAAVFRA